MSAISRTGWLLLALGFVYSFVPSVVGLTRVVELAGGPAIAPPNPRALSAPLPIAFHILSSSVFCLLGMFQFLPGLRAWRPRFHRLAGRVVAFSGIVSALSGLWMTLVFQFPSDLQGTALFWSRLLLSVTMLCLIIWSVVAIQCKKPSAHGAAMMRAYAIGQGAATQTVFGLAGVFFFNIEWLGPPRDIMMISAWVTNLVVAEFIVWSRVGISANASLCDRHPSVSKQRSGQTGRQYADAGH